jgi:hypothetical protein
MSLATQARCGETCAGRGPCTAPPGRVPGPPLPLSIKERSLPNFRISLFFSTSFNHHTVKEPHSEESFSATGFPFSPPLVLFASLVSRSLSLQEFEVSIHIPFSTLPSLVDLGEEEKKSLPGGLVTLGSPIIPWTHRPICDHKKTHHTLSTPHHRVFASPRRSQSGFPTNKTRSHPAFFSPAPSAHPSLLSPVRSIDPKASLLSLLVCPTGPL